MLVEQVRWQLSLGVFEFGLGCVVLLIVSVRLRVDTVDYWQL